MSPILCSLLGSAWWESARTSAAVLGVSPKTSFSTGRTCEAHPSDVLETELVRQPIFLILNF